VPEDHFLQKLKQHIPWERFTRRLIKLYKGGGMYGRPPFDPVLVLKVTLIAFFYNLSERQAEVYVNDNLSAKYFVGLAVDQKVPDHSTLTVFRERCTACASRSSTYRTAAGSPSPMSTATNIGCFSPHPNTNALRPSPAPAPWPVPTRTTASPRPIGRRMSYKKQYFRKKS
jgi:hypothetical protein